MTHNICVHTADKLYNEAEIEKADISSRSWNDAVIHAIKPHSNALNKQIWDENEIVYWKRDSSYEWIDDKTLDGIIKNLMFESSYQTPLVIRQRRRSSSDAQLKLNFLGPKDEPYFKNRPSVLAFAYGPASGLGGDCTMNSDHIWSLSKTKMTVKEAFDLGMIEDYNRKYPNNILTTYDPYHTLKHEMGGHALGMNHITDINERYTSIMYPYYNGLRRFGEADLKYLHQLYGESGLSHKMIEILSKRLYL